MNHSLNVEVAKKLGVNAALIIANLAYLQTQRAIQGGDEYYFEGRWWVRHSYQTLSEWHPYFSVPQIKRVMKQLIEAGHVVTRQPNHFNRTTYWSVAPEFLHSTESYDGKYGIVPSEGTESYDVLHDNKHITTTPCSPPSRFTPPTVSEVSDYFSERGGDPAEGERFVDFYESKGWLVGKSKMKSWKAAVRNWVSRSKSEKPRNSTELARRNSQAVSGDFKRSDTSWIEQG
jgi:hypothetical protein